MKLIDADKLQHDMYDAAFIQDSNMQKWDGGCWIRYKMFEKTLEKQDEAIVRCKDCKHYEIYQLKKDGTDDRRYKPSYCTLLRYSFKPDWFCADGERREDETD